MENTDGDLEALKRELTSLVSGGSYENIYQLLYYLALLKYATQEHIKSIGFAGAGKVATKGKLQALCEMGYLQLVKNDPPILITSQKSLQVLKALGHDLKLLPAVPKGTGAEIYNTDVFVQALKLPSWPGPLQRVVKQH